jgi:NAD(P)-dependent dehydrogenase (short-subunit alcohol dehydrogenase family)
MTARSTFSPDLFDGKVVLVTGGGSGLGQAIALKLASLGAKVAVTGRRVEPLQETVAAIEAAGGRAMWRSADVRDPSAIEALFDAVEAELGPIDGLVNNAAGNFLACAEDLSDNAFDAVVKTVMHGSFYGTRAAGRRWIAAGRKGVVLSIVVPYATSGSAFVLPSAMAKAGVLAMTRSLAVEWGLYGIRLNALSPGPFPTKGATDRLMIPGVAEAALQRVPLGRFGDPEELAELAAFLLCDASGYLTGQDIVLDGGEAIKGAGTFSAYTDMPRDQVKAMMAMMRPPKKA